MARFLIKISRHSAKQGGHKNDMWQEFKQDFTLLTQRLRSI